MPFDIKIISTGARLSCRTEKDEFFIGRRMNTKKYPFDVVFLNYKLHPFYLKKRKHSNGKKANAKFFFGQRRKKKWTKVKQNKEETANTADEIELIKSKHNIIYHTGWLLITLNMQSIIPTTVFRCCYCCCCWRQWWCRAYKRSVSIFSVENYKKKPLRMSRNTCA